MTSEPTLQPVNTAERLRAELTFMYELCQVVASHSELQPILDWIVQKTTTMLSADEGSIRLLSPDFATPTLKTLIRTEGPGLQSGSWPAGIAMNVMGFLMAKGQPLATPDLLDDPQFPSLKNQQTRIRAVLAVPLKVDNRFTGMLAVTQAAPGRRWNDDEKQLLAIVASNSASVIEQARLKIEADEKRRLEELQKLMERELDTARVIQMSLVPSRALRTGPWEVMGRVVPAKQVGGDAFDYFALEGGRFAVAIADVSGKGVPAALLMSNVQASLRAFCDGRMAIPDAMRQLNLGITRSANGKFITMFYGEVDPEAGVLRYTNAGHNYPLLRRQDGTLENLTEGGLPLGLMTETTYAQGECAFGTGDALLLYSDGISEAFDSRGREFGEERLREVWTRHGGGAPADVIHTVYAEVEAFRGRAVQSDDMTLVVVGRPTTV
jgi:sigma-B regulation protein RsbU (phosphoserine phosphatase)